MALNKDRRVVAVIGEVNEGVWDKASEFKTTAPSKEYHPGGGRTVPPVDQGGTAKHDPITIEKGVNDAVVDAKVLGWRKMVGRRVPIRVTDQLLDPDGNIIGSGETAIGIVLGAWKTGADSEDENVTMVAVNMSVLQIV